MVVEDRDARAIKQLLDATVKACREASHSVAVVFGRPLNQRVAGSSPTRLTTCFVTPLNPTAIAANPSQSLIQLSYRDQLIELSLHESELGGESVRFVGQDFEVTRDAARVAHVGKTRCVACGV